MIIVKQLKMQPNFNIPLNIVYEDDDVVVINKQAGISVHPSINEPFGTLANALIARYPEIKNVGENPMRPGIVHRLDKDTSGLLVVAKNKKVFEYLKKEWQDGRVIKKYLALVWGHLKNERGEIKSELTRSIKDFRKRMIVKSKEAQEIKGKLAVTEYRVVKNYPPPFGGRVGGYSLVEICPKTGRMHQIRVHMASIGHPVVGDKIYGKKRKIIEGLARQFLHAYYLSFSLSSGKKLALEVDLPYDLEQVLTKLSK